MEIMNILHLVMNPFNFSSLESVYPQICVIPLTLTFGENFKFYGINYEVLNRFNNGGSVSKKKSLIIYKKFNRGEGFREIFPFKKLVMRTLNYFIIHEIIYWKNSWSTYFGKRTLFKNCSLKCNYSMTDFIYPTKCHFISNDFAKEINIKYLIESFNCISKCSTKSIKIDCILKMHYNWI
ncbi:hypothetical protein AGLY_002536 [Aphis glycines]|uniref:Uncharacterized protein n=1 Tax=Aphis glycines TaxID=307491 RepID=A0A6G0U0K3_APHGL|nr:hypothetical protein AGLY_002536 [Aphis glycines]